MKRILASLFCTAMLLSAPVFADLALPGEDNPVLSENSIVLNQSKYNVVKRIDSGTVTLKVFTTEGKEMWVSAPLGEQEKLFTLEGAASPLAIKDLTGDGVPELVTAAMTGPESSALYVFKFDNDSQKFTAMNFRYEKENLSRDFLVSDMYQKDGQDLVFMPENKVRALGRIYSEETGPTAGFYFFELKENEFVCTEVAPVPVDAPTAPAVEEGK
ncbi:MAG: hypothetical protein PHD82_11580 [Candidatus Riflebacteria bacterium]|jgi:hypothetical protein|nr:hypothetical protein [Candidatus Riflebacteria bacterium]